MPYFNAHKCLIALRASLFWDVMQCRLVVSYRRFWTTVPSSMVKQSKKNAEQVQCSLSKVPLVIDRSQPNLRLLQRMCVECQMRIRRKIPPMEDEIQPRRYIALQAECL
jgi:hypothetical protein